MNVNHASVAVAVTVNDAPAAASVQSVELAIVKTVTSVLAPRVDLDVYVPEPEHAAKTAHVAKRASARSVRTAKNAVYVRIAIADHVRIQIQTPVIVPERYVQNAMSVQYAANAAAAMDPDRVAPELAPE